MFLSRFSHLPFWARFSAAFALVFAVVAAQRLQLLHVLVAAIGGAQ